HRNGAVGERKIRIPVAIEVLPAIPPAGEVAAERRRELPACAGERPPARRRGPPAKTACVWPRECTGCARADDFHGSAAGRARVGMRRHLPTTPHGRLWMPLLELTPDELLSTTRAVRRRLDLTRAVEHDVLEECV